MIIWLLILLCISKQLFRVCVLVCMYGCMCVVCMSVFVHVYSVYVRSASCAVRCAMYAVSLFSQVYSQSCSVRLETYCKIVMCVCKMYFNARQWRSRLITCALLPCMRVRNPECVLFEWIK